MTLRLENLLGNGLTAPLRRLAGLDYESASGVELVATAVRQILGTHEGELRWRPSFGASLDRFRHRNIDDELLAEIQSVVQRNLMQWEPRIVVGEVTAFRDESSVDSTILIVRVRWSVVGQGVNKNLVLSGPHDTETRI